MLGFGECCDATVYSDLGQICWSMGWQACFSEYRPVGAVALNAIMYPLGLAPLSHALLLAFALLFVVAFPNDFLERKGGHAARRGGVAQLLLTAFGAFVLLELLFMGLASVNLTDVPAGVLAAAAILGFARKNALLFALAGGACVLVRAAYLYPVAVIAAYFFFETLYKKQWGKVMVVPLFFLCLLPQFLVTYMNTGFFAFMDPSKVEYWTAFHLSSSATGYDTLIPPSGHRWGDLELGLNSALEQREWGGIVKLVQARLQFYLGSYVPLGKVYLNSPNERIFSSGIYVLHGMAAIVMSLYLMIRGIAWRVWAPILLILGQSLVIIPEQRFVFVIQLLLVMFTYVYVLYATQQSRNKVGQAE